MARSPARRFLIELGQQDGIEMRVPGIAFLGILAASIGAPAQALAEEFQMQEVSSLQQTAGTLAPHTILFTDHRKDELVDPTTGLIHFSDWERLRLSQKQLLSLFPTFEEPTVTVSDETAKETGSKTRKRRLHVYVA